MSFPITILLHLQVSGLNSYKVVTKRSPGMSEWWLPCLQEDAYSAFSLTAKSALSQRHYWLIFIQETRLLFTITFQPFSSFISVRPISDSKRTKLVTGYERRLRTHQRQNNANNTLSLIDQFALLKLCPPRHLHAAAIVSDTNPNLAWHLSTLQPDWLVLRLFPLLRHPIFAERLEWRLET